MAENDKSKAKKQVPLRLSPTLYNELSAWAEDEFRSLNGQIEYLLTECVKKRKKPKKEPTEEEELERVNEMFREIGLDLKGEGNKNG